MPTILIAFRAACAPLIVLLAYRGVHGWTLAGVLFAALLSDVFDGVIARRQGIATPALRHADTIVDTVFYTAAAAALAIAIPRAFAGTESLLAIFVTIHMERAIFEVVKYGRVASYHMWSAKLFGLLLAGAFGSAFIMDRATPWLGVALLVGVWNEIEGFAASAMLPHWRPDVPSIVHAARRSPAP